jgi:putative inorganic carbon (HCO3(-)) transporter
MRGITMFTNRFLLTLIAISPVISVLVYPAVIFLAVCRIIKGESGGFLFQLKRDRVLLIFLISVFVSSILSQNPLISLGAYSIFIVQVLAYMNVKSEKSLDRNKLLFILVGVGGIVSLFGIIQYLFVNITMPQRWLDRTLYDPQQYKRVFSTFMNPNVLAGYIIFVISFSVALLHRKNWLVIIILVLSLLCLFFTFSRGGWLGAAAAILTVIGMKRDNKSAWVLVVTFTVLLAAFWPEISGRANGLLEDSTFKYRIEIWKTAVEVFMDYPLFGCGFGTAWRVIPETSPNINAIVGHAHNLYLNFAMETGIFGLVSFVVFIGSRIVRGYKKFKASYGSERDLAAGIIGGLVGMLFHGIVDAVPIAPQLGIIIWLLLGLAGI